LKKIGVENDVLIKENLLNNWSQLKPWEKAKFNQYFKKIDIGNKAVSIENLLDNLIKDGMDSMIKGKLTIKLASNKPPQAHKFSSSIELYKILYILIVGCN
jgi:hypothetical protein